MEVLTLFQAGSGITLPGGGGAIMAQVFSRRHNFAKRPPSAQNLLLDKYFDL